MDTMRWRVLCFCDRVIQFDLISPFRAVWLLNGLSVLGFVDLVEEYWINHTSGYLRNDKLGRDACGCGLKIGVGSTG